jgi:hypothetical protein
MTIGPIHIGPQGEIMTKLIRACIAMAAFAAIFVLPSMASASITLTHPTGTVYNGNIIATNVAHSGTPTQTVLTTNLGKVVCGSATITGKIIQNNGTHVLGTVETANFAGTHEKTTTGHCGGEGFVGSTVTPTPSHTSDEQGSGRPASLPWCITAGAEDKFEVWGEVEGSCTNGKTRPVTFTLHGSLTCGYEKAIVVGTYTTHPADALVTIEQTFSRRAGESAFCPSTGTLKMSFTLTAETKTNEETAPVYIDK